MIEVHCLGAAGTVTGSMHLLRTDHGNVLLDCGLFQGRRRESAERNRNLPIKPADVDAVVLSHAHIDHSGALPILGKRGYRGPVYTTPATRDLLTALLEDAAMIQASDVKFLHKLLAKGEIEEAPDEPLYDLDDVETLLRCVVPVPYRETRELMPGVQLTLLDAGHILGSAQVLLDIQDGARRVRLCFTGDLGRRNMPILRDPEQPAGVHAVLCESTYGDRLHDSIETMDDKLAEIVTRTVARKGKVLVPSFAMERAQEVVYALARLRAAGRVPLVPVYVDSPLAVKLTQVFGRHPDCFDADAAALVGGGGSPFTFDGLRYVSDVEDSKAITESEQPSIIVAASGMCEFGRVLHHLKAMVATPRHTVAIVGFQAPHTLGRRLVERRTQVRIFGMLYDRRCEIEVLNGFSAHADQGDLLSHLRGLRERGPLGRVALVHGEAPAQGTLARLLAEQGFGDVTIPAPGDVWRL